MYFEYDFTVKTNAEAVKTNAKDFLISKITINGPYLTYYRNSKFPDNYLCIELESAQEDLGLNPQPFGSFVDNNASHDYLAHDVMKNEGSLDLMSGSFPPPHVH
jgi:hypothetical protein